MLTNIIFIAIVVLIALAGALVGFARWLKFFTSGIFGIAISIAACVMLGGVLVQIPVISGLIDSINRQFVSWWDFFKYLYIGLVVYYVCLFLIVQLVRYLLVKIIKSILESENKVVRFVNKLGGAVLLTAFFLALLLVFFSVVKATDDTEISIKIVAFFSDTWLAPLYENNPIRFHLPATI